MNNIKKYGFNKQNIDVLSNEAIGRIISRSHDIYKVITDSGEINAEISESLKFEAKALADYPVSGDFVKFESKNGFNYITHIINRKNQLMRKGEWDANSDYLIASNIDTIYIMISLDNDFHTEKLKAYISIASNLNTETIVVLNNYNSDIPDNIIDEINDLTKDMNVIISSDISKEKSKIQSYIKEGQTVIFIGPEHDKARMVNELYENINLENQLTLLSNGGILINTPEMRELGIESFHIAEKFADIR